MIIANINVNKLHDEFIEKGIYPYPVSALKKGEGDFTFTEDTDMELVQQIINAHDPTPSLPQPTEEEVLQKQKELTREQTTLAVKLIAPTFSDEVLFQIPLLFDEWAVGIDYVADKSVVRYENDLYRVITSHRSQADWPPSDVPALYVRIAPPGVIPEWRQPLGEHDAYQTGDKVKHNDKTWISTEDDNVWEPGIHGWEIVA